MTAIISSCGRYRYTLERQLSMLGKRGACLFIMLNPSTADAELDDPTIRRCKGFAEGFGYNHLIVVNLFAFRATKPADLYKSGDPVGPHNDTHIRRAMKRSGLVICGWGSNDALGRDTNIKRFAVDTQTELKCLGKTKGGAPKHPLYLPSVAALEDW